MSLITAKNITDSDAAYAALIAAHKGLTPDQSQALNARLILILMNHIGEMTVIEQALALAARCAETS
ncbi:DUF2783 domain-containing protein [Phaeovulum sp. W22_SRMD_FR3]|uniref:DUF2783 domain-containing protein n=1 Tax=Phaeovulum sp. W22_SRMD_FR3 TaxID=3240274 RepID=UPI003F9549C0